MAMATSQRIRMPSRTSVSTALNNSSSGGNLTQVQCGEPAAHDFTHRGFASGVEVIAVGDDLDGARAAAAARELLGRLQIARFPVAAHIEHRAADARRELEDVRAVGELEEALGAGDVPPAGQEHQLAASARTDHFRGP